MAIKDMKGTVIKDKATMTGMVNKSAAKITPPNMSKIKMPIPKKQVAQKPAQTKPMQPQSAQTNLAEKVQNLTNEEKSVLSTVLSPSVNNVLKKLEPSLAPLLDAAGTNEENMIIPVSVVKSFAAKRYGGQNETESVTNFIADLQESAPKTMDQQSVPPDTQMAETENSIIQSEIDEIDSGIMEA
jgi:hypothetical protein